jgi:hypothetical protein
MSEEKPNVGKQFEEIMGTNFTPQEERNMHAKALADRIMEIGEEVFGKQSDEDKHNDQYATRLSRMQNFPESMVRHDHEGLPEVFHSCKTCGLDHTWKGYSRIDHGSVDSTGIMDYSKNDDQQDYAKGNMTPEKFFSHVKDFHEAYGHG